MLLLISRKWPKSLLLFAIILLMGTLSLIGLSMKGRPKKLHQKAWDPLPIASPCRSTAGPIREPLGGWESQEKISKNQPGRGITSSIKRINAIADILDHEIIETEETLQNQSPERAKYFKNTLMVTGVNDSSKKISLSLEPTSWSRGAPDR